MSEDMKHALSEAEQRDTELRALVGRIQDAAVKLQTGLGALIALTGKKVRAKDTLGDRVPKFRKADTSALIAQDLKATISEAAAALTEPYRNRITHDEWHRLAQRDAIPEGSVTGWGEGHVTSTNMGSLRLILEAFLTVEAVVSFLYSEIEKAQRSGGLIEPLESDDARRAITHALDSLSHRSPGWLWSTMEAADDEDMREDAESV